MENVDAYLEVAVRAARRAGEVLQDYVGRFSVREKAPADLVTSADLAAQQAVQDTVAEAFPDHDFMGEEENGPPLGEATHRWIVDPLDGTTNYVHRIPFYCTSVALEIEGRLAVGVIHDPCTRECFAATAGRGATLNGEPIHVSDAPDLARAVVMTGFPTDVGRTRANVNHFLNFIGRCQSVRRMGSAALNLAYLACGRVDGNWATSLYPWDKAAGVLLVQEAGGTVTDLGGGLHNLYEPSLLATNGCIHEAMLAVLGSG